jgi:hypothetical protein
VLEYAPSYPFPRTDEGGKMDRPTGVYVIAFLQVLNAAYLVSLGFFWRNDNPTLAILALALGIFMFILSAATFVMKPWSWTATLILQMLSIIHQFVAYFWQGSYFGIVSFIISVIIIYYLTRPEIRKGFGH